jgi:HlyD family type I secretion membrane fusion protein
MSARDLVPFGAQPPAPPPPAPPIGRWTTIGLTVAFVTFGGFGSWAALAPLSSAAMAPGIVKVDSNRKTIQHYEGGIIREILVRDGDLVAEGQVIVRLDDLDAQADHGSIRGQLDALLAREARLIAQRDGKDAITFPTRLVDRTGQDPELATILEGQKRIFEDHARALAAESGIWASRAEQYRAQIAVLESQIETLEIQATSFEEELVVARDLFERGYERKPRVLALEREVTRTRGEIVANRGRILALSEQVTEAQAQIVSMRETRAKSVSEELRQVQTERADLAQREQKSDARVGRRDLVAPQAGVVMNLRYFTAGGVIAPGAEIMDIVPAEDNLVIEARVRPLDINIVRPGLTASVRLVAFKQRSTPTLEGRVTRVSADALADPRTGEIYFLATVEVGPSELARAPGVTLYPGMPTEVAIVTGERTLVAYLTQPLTDSFAHAFRED